MADRTTSGVETGSPRFEYRVWGDYRKARKLLAKLASAETFERVTDCYLLIEDASWNAKLRGSTLKIKQLVDERKGFERWVVEKHRSAATAPSPFDELFDGLDFDELFDGVDFDELREDAEALQAVLEGLEPHEGIRPVVVVKSRRRYSVGTLRAEVTEIEIVETEEVLRTLAIEGDDFDELVALRRRLGLRGEPNTPVHLAIDSETDR